MNSLEEILFMDNKTMVGLCIRKVWARSDGAPCISMNSSEVFVLEHHNERFIASRIGNKVVENRQSDGVISEIAAGIFEHSDGSLFGLMYNLSITDVPEPVDMPDGFALLTAKDSSVTVIKKTRPVYKSERPSIMITLDYQNNVQWKPNIPGAPQKRRTLQEAVNDCVLSIEASLVRDGTLCVAGQNLKARLDEESHSGKHVLPSIEDIERVADKDAKEFKDNLKSLHLPEKLINKITGESPFEASEPGLLDVEEWCEKFKNTEQEVVQSMRLPDDIVTAINDGNPFGSLLNIQPKHIGDFSIIDDDCDSSQLPPLIIDEIDERTPLPAAGQLIEPRHENVLKGIALKIKASDVPLDDSVSPEDLSAIVENVGEYSVERYNQWWEFMEKAILPGSKKVAIRELRKNAYMRLKKSIHDQFDAVNVATMITGEDFLFLNHCTASAMAHLGRCYIEKLKDKDRVLSIAMNQHGDLLEANAGLLNEIEGLKKELNKENMRAERLQRNLHQIQAIAAGVYDAE